MEPMFANRRPPPSKTFCEFPSPFTFKKYHEACPVQAEPPYTLQEIEMQGLSYSIRSKPDWQTKRLDPAIRAKWKIEALEQSEKRAGNHGDDRLPLTEMMVERVLDELEAHARLHEVVDGLWREGCIDKVYESDLLIPDNLRASLISEVSKLESVPEQDQDWHPGSHRQVLDLVHPSLFPVVYGRSLIRKTDADGKIDEFGVIPEPIGPDEEETGFLSNVFQWLPTDFTVKDDGKVKIESYINSLHPGDHARLYPIIAKLFGRFVPMFDRALSELREPSPRAIDVTSEIAFTWYDEFDENEWEKTEGVKIKDEKERESARDHAWDNYEETRAIKLPAPDPAYEPPLIEKVRAGVKSPLFTIKSRTVQVIVKLANIELTPEAPEYPGGVWHVEGMQNESIVATGIYYYDQDNISESSLAFRGTFDASRLHYRQSDDRGVGYVYGIEADGATVQELNAANTTANRCLVFPNIYQHRVSPFGLIDKTKPGHRKILVFFLVDPLVRIPSTTDIAPQQRSWIERELFKERSSESVLNTLPNELWNRILELTDGLITLDEAKEYREQLMKERKFMVDAHTNEVFESVFAGPDSHAVDWVEKRS